MLTVSVPLLLFIRIHDPIKINELCKVEGRECYNDNPWRRFLMIWNNEISQNAFGD